MNKIDDWRDIKYQEIFEEETRGLIRRRQADPNCTVDDINGILNNLYILDGANQDGRGNVQDIIINARIAAYERFIAQWTAGN
ncbi:MAG: hypothetical protein FWC03_07035 [Treponema sp.]|nr:hypothetical protein [Treponema sp.]